MQAAGRTSKASLPGQADSGKTGTKSSFEVISGVL
jgi:hypothetical protein